MRECHLNLNITFHNSSTKTHLAFHYIPMITKLPNITNMIRALIAKPSISSCDSAFDSSNHEVINLLAEWLEQLGFSITIHEVAPGKSNLLAKLGGDGVTGQGLVLSGHTDTVPFDEGQWTYDPFGGVEKDDRLYGLGSCDMKAFFAIAIEAIKSFENKSFRKPITLLATADEESTMAGAKFLATNGLKMGRYAVIGEPTGLKPIRMHKGVMMEKISVHGHAGHSSDPSLGANAIEGMNRVLNELLAWRKELQAKHKNPMFKVDVPTLNFGSIQGGDNPNRICARCEVSIDIRPLPGMDILKLRQTMGERIAATLSEFPKLHLESYPLFDGLPAFELPAESEIVKACETLCNTKAGAVAFGTEAPFLSSLGIETIILGAGNIEQAHQPNEYISLNQINPMIHILKGLIKQFCMQ